MRIGSRSQAILACLRDFFTFFGMWVWKRDRSGLVYLENQQKLEIMHKKHSFYFCILNIFKTCVNIMLIQIVDNPQSTIYNHQYMKGEEEKKMEALITRTGLSLIHISEPTRPY